MKQPREIICRSDPKPGDFVLLPVPGPLGKLIEIGQFLDGQKFRPYEHAEIYIGSVPGLRNPAGPYGYTISAYPGGKGLQPLPCPARELPGAYWSSGIVPLTSMQRADIIDWAWDHQDVEYSAADYLALVLARLKLNLVLPPLRRYIEDSEHLICSQFVVLAYMHGRVSLMGRPWDGLVTPMQLAEKLDKIRTGHGT